MTKLCDLTGKRFGKLVVLYRADNHVSKNGNSRVVWHCRCDCGNEIDVMALNLTRNHTISCGCAREDGRVPLTLDVTGQKYYHLTAIRKIKNINSNGTKWLFRCDCGNEIEAYLANVRSGKTKSCGLNCPLKNHKVSNEPKGPQKDLKGQKFGLLTVKDFAYIKNGQKYWLCECSCGNVKAIRAWQLMYAHTQSCGCLQKAKALDVNINDIQGNRFGKLTVLRLADSKYGKKHWLCECDCGNLTIVSTSGLKSGHTQSCGCFQDETAHNTHYIDLVGRKFGRLTVLERVANSNTGIVRYLCGCECGKNTIVASSHLISGSTQSCGCWKYSSMEELVLNYLQNNHYINTIDYDCQKRFNGLLGTGKLPLSYDFVIYKNQNPVLLIECQGQQHYYPVKRFGGEEKFKIQKQHDFLKREYAKLHGIDLLEIPYTVNKYDDMKKILDNAISKYI